MESTLEQNRVEIEHIIDTGHHGQDSASFQDRHQILEPVQSFGCNLACPSSLPAQGIILPAELPHSYWVWPNTLSIPQLPWRPRLRVYSDNLEYLAPRVSSKALSYLQKTPTRNPTLAPTRAACTVSLGNSIVAC